MYKRQLLNNLHSYPSDTPVYENLGYLGDGHLTQEMGMYNFDMIRYYEKWANDIRDQSKSSGYMEQTAPMWDETKANAPEWSAAICPVSYTHLFPFSLWHSSCPGCGTAGFLVPIGRKPL